jgi:hypothetical protein
MAGLLKTVTGALLCDEMSASLLGWKHFEGKEAVSKQIILDRYNQEFKYWIDEAL